MQAKSRWTIQSFLSCLFWNGILLGLLFYVAREFLRGLHQWIDPLLQPGALDATEEVRTIFGNLNQMVLQGENYLIPFLLGSGGVITLLLWLSLWLQGRGAIKRAHREAALSAPAPVREKPAKASTKKEVPMQAPQPPAPPSPQAAVQMLSILQREGRLIDFLQENLDLYDDAQIGAAVRSIHQGCKSALAEYVELKPIFEENEGAEVTVARDFDASSIRLTGNVTGEPPFSGTLRHRGWRVMRVQLPQPTSEPTRQDWVLAPAEVEIGG